DLRDIASVDLVDDEDEALGRLCLRGRHHLLKDAGLKLEAVAVGPISLDEVLVGVHRVKGACRDKRIGSASSVDDVALAVGELRRQAIKVVARDDLKRDALRVVRLARTRRAVEDDLPLSVEHVYDLARDAFK